MKQSATLERKSATTDKETETETLYPNRDKLISLLDTHKVIAYGIREFESKLSRSELDLDNAIDNDRDEDIGRYQSQVSVFNVKVGAKKTALRRVIESLPEAIFAASNEFSTLLLDERNRRVGILSKRVADALGADADRLVEGQYLNDVLDLAKPIADIDSLRLSFSLVNVSDEGTISVAKLLLDHYSDVLAAAKESI
jgi:hypothetical protein